MEKSPPPFSAHISSEHLVTGISPEDIDSVIDHLYEVVPEVLHLPVRIIPGAFSEIIASSMRGSAALLYRFGQNSADLSLDVSDDECLKRSAYSANVAVYAYGALRAAAHNDRLLAEEANSRMTDLTADELGFHLDRALAGGAIFHAAPRATPPKLYERFMGLYSTPYDPNLDQWGGLLVETLHTLGGAPTRREVNTPFDYTMFALGKWIRKRLEGRAYRPRTEQETPSDIAIVPTLQLLGNAALVNRETEARRREDEARIFTALETKAAAIAEHQKLMETGRNGRNLKLKGKEIRNYGLKTFNGFLHRGYQEPDKGIFLRDIDPYRAPLVLGLFMAMREWLESASPDEARRQLAGIIDHEQQLEQQHLYAQQELISTSVAAEKFHPLIQEAVLWIRQQWEALERIFTYQDWPPDAAERAQLSHNIKELLRIGKSGTWDWLE